MKNDLIRTAQLWNPNRTRRRFPTGIADMAHTIDVRGSITPLPPCSRKLIGCISRSNNKTLDKRTAGFGRVCTGLLWRKHLINMSALKLSRLPQPLGRSLQKLHKFLSLRHLLIPIPCLPKSHLHSLRLRAKILAISNSRAYTMH